MSELKAKLCLAYLNMESKSFPFNCDEAGRFAEHEKRKERNQCAPWKGQYRIGNDSTEETFRNTVEYFMLGLQPVKYVCLILPQGAAISWFYHWARL